MGTRFKIAAAFSLAACMLLVEPACGYLGSGFAGESLTGSHTAYAAETIPASPLLSQIDISYIDSIMTSGASGASYGIAVMDLNTGDIVGTSEMNTAMTSSVMIDIPILYTVQRLIEAGTITLDSQITFSFEANGRSTLTEANDGQVFSLNDMLMYMLKSDNNATNNVLNFLTMATVNSTCNSNGFQSVLITKPIAHTVDGSPTEDNYVSAADLVGMLRYLYNCQGPINREFLEQNMHIQDDKENVGLRHGFDAEGDFNKVFLNLNGFTNVKFNEVALVEDTAAQQAYAISYLAHGIGYQTLQGTAAQIGPYIRQQTDAGIQMAQQQAESQAASEQQSEQESQAASESESQAASESESQAASEAESEAMAAEQETESSFVSNDGEVVSDGTKTYWWQYSEDSVPTSFLCDLRHESNEDSQLMCQDGENADPKPIAKGGFGPICLTTNGFVWYQTGTGDNEPKTVALDPETGDTTDFDGSLAGVTKDASAVILKNTGSKQKITVTDGNGLSLDLTYDDKNDAAYAGSQGGKYYFALADSDSITIREMDPETGSGTDIMTGKVEDRYSMEDAGIYAKLAGGVIYAGIYDVESSDSSGSRYKYGEIMSFSLIDQSVSRIVSAANHNGLMDDHFILLQDEDDQDSPGTWKIYYRGGSDEDSIDYSVSYEINRPWSSDAVYVALADGSGKPEASKNMPLVADNGFCWLGGTLAYRPEGSGKIMQGITGKALADAGWTDLYPSEESDTLSEITSFNAVGTTLYMTLTRFTADPDESFGWHKAYKSESVVYRTEAMSDNLEEIYRY